MRMVRVTQAKDIAGSPRSYQRRTDRRRDGVQFALQTNSVTALSCPFSILHGVACVIRLPV